MSDDPLAPRRFVKMHGLGNDFVVLDARDGRAPLPPAVVRALADRRRGVGFDQLVEIRAGDAEADATLTFLNPDGSRAGACGNATRCVAERLMRETGRDALVLRTDRGRLTAARGADGSVAVNMGAPVLDAAAIPLAPGADPDRPGLPEDAMALSMGNPHCVVFVADAETAPVTARGPELERHPLFPERANIEFVEVRGPDRLRVRVWERGTGVTPACGSGACAAAVAAARRGLTGRRVTVEMDGGALEVDWREDGVRLSGPTATAFEGVLDADWLAAALAAEAAA